MPVTLEPKPEDIREAISLRSANSFIALFMANAFGGAQTPAWELCHRYSLRELLEHAAKKGISLTGLRSAVDDLPIEESLYFRLATGKITQPEFQEARLKWKRGETP